MAFADDFGDKIHRAYFRKLESIQNRTPDGISGSTYRNCQSAWAIATAVKMIVKDGVKNHLSDLEITNNIIFELLNKKYFVYENTEMSVITGYIYLHSKGIQIQNYTFGNITENSSLEDIRQLTAAW